MVQRVRIDPERGAQRVPDRAVRRRRLLGRIAPDKGHVADPQHLLDETGLPDSRLAGDEREAAAARPQAYQSSLQRGALPRAPDERVLPDRRRHLSQFPGVRGDAPYRSTRFAERRGARRS